MTLQTQDNSFISVNLAGMDRFNLGYANSAQPLQSLANGLYLSLSGVETHETSSLNTAHKTGVKCKNISNNYKCIYTTVSMQCRLLQLIYWYVFNHIINTLLALAKLFCLVGRNREYNSYFGSKYLLLGWFLVSNLPDYISKNKPEEVLTNAK